MSICLEKVKQAKIASIIYTENIVVTWGQSKLKLAKLGCTLEKAKTNDAAISKSVKSV